MKLRVTSFAPQFLVDDLERLEDLDGYNICFDGCPISNQ